MLTLLVSGCDGDQVDLFVDLRTDWVSGAEFFAVRTELFENRPSDSDMVNGTRSVIVPALADDAFVEAVRVADFAGLEVGGYWVRSSLLGASGNIVAARLVQVEIRSSQPITVVVSRDCGGLTCPGAGDDPALIACQGGRCVDPRCAPEQPETCGDVACTGDPDCPAAAASCAIAACVAGSCLFAADPDACDPDLFYCSPTDGCLPRSGSPCDDTLMNGDETDIDCGGSCDPCANGSSCLSPIDCESGFCNAGICATPACDDGAFNGDEADIDCGGSCPACPDLSPCRDAADCASGVCFGSICVSAGCADGVANGDETDVDCGGSCARCTVADDCLEATDCDTGLCSGGQCDAAVSCLGLLTAAPGAGSGTYVLDADGAGGADPFPAYCDMVAENGGWTLVMKISTGTTLAYDAPYWTTEELLNEADGTPNSVAVGADAKFPAFNQVTGAVLRLEWRDPADHSFRFTALADRTALELFTGPEVLVVGNESSGCHGRLLNAADGWLSSRMRHGRGRQFFGINGRQDTRRIRFGFGSNDEDTSFWNGRHAVGMQNTNIRWAAHTDCNGCGGCYGTAYDASPTSANLWVR